MRFSALWERLDLDAGRDGGRDAGREEERDCGWVCTGAGARSEVHHSGCTEWMLSDEVLRVRVWPGLSSTTSWFDGVVCRPKNGTGGVTLFKLLVCEELRFCSLRLGRFLSYWLVIVVVIVVVGLSGGEA
jgi:hypothetical protein